jgi:4-methylaminobutanoate oxidase (formaldehyde-forming)
MLNSDGGIETDLTVICLDKDYFRIISSAATRERDKFHIKKHLHEDIELKDVTDDFCVFGLFGPKSRDLIQSLSNNNFKNDNFKFATAKYIIIDGVKIWAQRLSYVGELGYELYVEFKDAKKIYDLIIEAGKNFELSNCGMHAMDIMRMESGFLHWGHDISPEENQYEANLNFSISLKKDYDFIGKESLLKMKDKKPKKRLIMLCLQESKPGEPLMLHDEPIYLDNKIIGVTTSGNYSFNFNKNLSFGYIKSEHSNLELSKKNLYIEIEKIKYPAEVLLNPLKQTDFKKI